jgi:squalene-hopene/tetraprenyl-beta-curcumene cyclase
MSTQSETTLKTKVQSGFKDFALVRFDLDTRVEEGIKRSQDYLISIQKPDGHWVGELTVDATLVSDLILFMHWWGEVDFAKQAKCVKHILDRQLPDGGWNIYVGGPSELNASVKAYFALKLAGHAPEEPYMRRAHSTILRLGGIPKVNTYCRLYLALLGQFSWRYTPSIPVELVLFPNWFYFNMYEMSSWSRAMLVPLAIINHFKPTRVIPPEKQLHELFPYGTEHNDFSLQFDKRNLTWRNFFLHWNTILKFMEDLPWKPMRLAALRKAERWMLERIGDGSDGLGAIFPSILNSIIALKAMGYSDDHPILQRQLAKFAELEVDDLATNNFRMQPCLSPVWDTAITGVALAESGLPPDHPSLAKAGQWLLDREVRVRGDWSVKNPKVEASGWAFEYNNPYYPDVDDTAKVLLALRLIQTSNDANRKEVVDRALKWLISFQCQDGGWAAFDKDITKKWLEDVPFADHNAILDPTCSDITAKVLECLGKFGYRTDHPVIKRALVMMRRTQESDGSWWGRWGVNYIYGTFQALRGLGALNLNMNEDWIVRARDWLESCQNPDGGWGETCASYDDPSLKGKGVSTASQTAWALMGILACGNPMRTSIQRGIEFLLSTQNPDGSWTEEETTGTGFPRVFYLRYDMYRNNWPLLALAEYRKSRAKFPA